jgi:S-DNA-T family DNA segregation ATPase FtsK/SpoIIIE
MTSTSGGDDDVTEEDEELVTKCLEIIRQERKASTSMLQRRLRLGYTRAARVVENAHVVNQAGEVLADALGARLGGRGASDGGAGPAQGQGDGLTDAPRGTGD